MVASVSLGEPDQYGSEPFTQSEAIRDYIPAIRPYLLSHQFQTIGASIMANSDRFSRAFSFILNSGREIFPVAMKRRDTGRIAFRVSKGGAQGNTLAAGEEVDEPSMIRMVLEEGHAVRCASLDGEIHGLYKQGHRSVRETRLGSGL